MARDDIGRLGIVQENLRKHTDFLRRVIAPVGGLGGVTLSYVCPQCNCFPLENYSWWVSTGHGDSAVCGGKYEWIAPNRIQVVQLGANASAAKVFRAHAAPQGKCEKLINALKLQANQQTDGDSPILSIVTGLQKRNRKDIMDGLRSFIEIDNHSALDVGHLRKGSRLRSAKGGSG